MNLNIIKIHYPYIEPASYDSLCPHTHFKKNGKSFKILHTCAGPVILDKTEFFFSKGKNKVVNRKRLPGEHSEPEEKEHLHSSIYM